MAYRVAASSLTMLCACCVMLSCHCQRRLLSFREGNLFDATDATQADIIILETNILQVPLPVITKPAMIF